MSLIEEALRRLQDPWLPPAHKTPATTPRPAQQKPPAAHPWPSTPPTTPAPTTAQPQPTALIAVAIAVLALTVVLIAGGIAWLGRTLSGGSAVVSQPLAQQETSSPATQSQTAQATPEVARTASPTAAPAPRRPSAAQDPFVLSGVVEGRGAPYAVINGAIVGIGEQVEGATLVTIEEGTVTLRLADGQDVELHITH